MRDCDPVGEANLDLSRVNLTLKSPRSAQLIADSLNCERALAQPEQKQTLEGQKALDGRIDWAPPGR